MSPIASKPSPLGRGVRDAMRLADEGMQAAGTAWCDVLLCTIPHQSPTAPASPKGSLLSFLPRIAPNRRKKQTFFVFRLTCAAAAVKLKLYHHSCGAPAAGKEIL